MSRMEIPDKRIPGKDGQSICVNAAAGPGGRIHRCYCTAGDGGLHYGGMSPHCTEIQILL